MTVADKRRSDQNAGVWIDHRKAQIVGLTPAGEVTSTIQSNVEKHPERGGDSPMKGAFEARQVPADDRRQRALTGHLDVYYDAVIDALDEYGKWLVIGPGEAKGELRARMLKRKFGDRISAVETEDHMTDREIVARVRKYFGETASSG